MKKNLFALAVLSAFAVSHVSFANDAATAPAAAPVGSEVAPATTEPAADSKMAGEADHKDGKKKKHGKKHHGKKSS